MDSSITISISKMQRKVEQFEKTEQIMTELSKLKTMFSCAKCKHIYTDPMRFKCTHVVCHKCIDVIGTYITCPICFKKTSQCEFRKSVEFQPAIDYILSIQKMFNNQLKYSNNQQLQTITNFNNVPNISENLKKKTTAENIGKLDVQSITKAIDDVVGTPKSIAGSQVSPNESKENRSKVVNKGKRKSIKAKKMKNTSIMADKKDDEVGCDEIIVEATEPQKIIESPIRIASPVRQESDKDCTETVNNLPFHTVSIFPNAEQQEVFSDTAMHDLQEPGTSQTASKHSESQMISNKLDTNLAKLECIDTQLQNFILMFYRVKKLLKQRVNEANYQTSVFKIIHRCIKKIHPKIKAIQEIMSDDEDDDSRASVLDKSIQTGPYQQSISVQTDSVASPQKKESQPAIFSNSLNFDNFDTQAAINAAQEKENEKVSNTKSEGTMVSQVMRNVETTTQTAMEPESLRVAEKTKDGTVYKPTSRRKKGKKRIISDTHTQSSKKSKLGSLDGLECELSDFSELLSDKLHPPVSITFDSETEVDVAKPNDTIKFLSTFESLDDNPNKENILEEKISSQAPSAPKPTQHKVQILNNITVVRPEEIPDDLEIIEESDEEANNITISNEILTPCRISLNTISKASLNLSPITPVTGRIATGKALQKYTSTPHLLNQRRNVELTPFKQSASDSKVIIMTSRLSTEDQNEVLLLSSRNIVSYKADIGANFTHLVVETDSLNRVANLTAKYIMAVAAGTWVVSTTWVRECLKANKLILEESFEVRDVDGGEGPRKSRLSGPNDKLFKTYSFYLLNIIDWKDEHIRDMIQRQGGNIVTSLNMLVRGNRTGIVISQTNASQELDDNNVYDEILQRYKVISVDVEWLTKSIRYFEVVGALPYLLCNSENIEDLKNYPICLWDSWYDSLLQN